jgi:hypothetical protein
MSERLAIHGFDEPTNTLSYLIWDSATKKGADRPSFDFDHRPQASTSSADRLLAAAGGVQ